MAKKNCNLPLKEWEVIINDMDYDELQECLAYPSTYYPQFLELVKKKMDDLSSVPEHEVIKNMVKQYLEEWGCPYEDEEDVLKFYFQGGLFHAFIKDDGHYIHINEYSWKSVSIDDSDGFQKLVLAINEANGACTVNTFFTINREENTIDVSCYTAILYRPMITNLKDYLHIRLQNFFYAHDLVNAQITLMEERERWNQPNEKDSEPNLLDPNNLPIC